MNQNFTKYNNPTLVGVKLPLVEIEPKYYQKLDIPKDSSDYNFLRRLCWEGIKEKGIDKLDNAQDYYDRIKMELQTFEELLFTPYIILNWAILNFCDESGIMTGRGRGSCVGSCVLYVLKVTHIDPLKHGLYFERFVSKNRAKKIEFGGETFLDGSLLPDCDHDIEFESRKKVIEYINQKFAGKTSKILTLNTMSGKMCIRECLKIAEGANEQEANNVSDTIPKKFGKVLDFDDAIEESERFKQYTEQYPKAYKIAKKLEGLVKNTGVHPSGLAISHYKIDDVMPLQSTGDGEIISGFEMNDVSSLMVKFDILGLRTLSVLEQTAKAVGVDFKTFSPPKDEVYPYLQNLLTPQGIFQIETDVGFRVCQKVKPNDLDELSDVLSLSRPGSLSFVDEYVKVKDGRQSIAERWPSLDAILSKTKGTILFQETIMQVCNQVFGLSLLDAESVRRATGKKKREEMDVWKPIIFKNAAEKNIPEEIAQFFWDAMIASADYSFNKSIGGDSIVSTFEGLKRIKDVEIGDKVLAFETKASDSQWVEVIDKMEHETEMFEFEMSDGNLIECSLEHKFLCSDGLMRPILEILNLDLEIVTD